MMLLIGSHVSLGGEDQFLGSVKEALSYGANALMVYTGAPQNTVRKPIEELRIPEALALMEQENIHPENVIVHAPYIVNLANPDPEKQDFAVSFLTQEVIRSGALGSKVLVLHPGAHMNDGADAGVDRIVSGVNRIIENTEGSDVVIALEGMAGKGTEVGRTFGELASIINGIHDKRRIGVCLDTCHMNDAGYNVTGDFDGVLDEFDRIVGIRYLKVLHVNDSKNPIASHKDRHENIGFGEVGFAPLVNAIHNPRIGHIPKILETPYIPSPLKEKVSYPPYRFEIDMIRKRKFDPELKQRVIESFEQVSK